MSKQADAFRSRMWPEKPKRKRAREPERKQASDEGDDFDRGEQ